MTPHLSTRTTSASSVEPRTPARHARPPYAEYGPDAGQEKHEDMRPWPKPRQRDLWLDALTVARLPRLR